MNTRQRTSIRYGLSVHTLLVIVRRGRLPVSVIIVVGDGHLPSVHVHVDELYAEVLL